VDSSLSRLLALGLQGANGLPTSTGLTPGSIAASRFDALVEV
jgi:hypothetical protein